MKATVTSTDRVVDITDINGGRTTARVWEGVTDRGIPFTAYITTVQVLSAADNTEFQQALQQHKAPSAETVRAIDARFII